MNETFAELISFYRWRYFYKQNPVMATPPLPKEEAAQRGIVDAFRTFMKNHNGDWYRSPEFTEMFQACPMMELRTFVTFFYGTGHDVKDNVNVSARVLESLTEIMNKFKDNPHTRKYALHVASVIGTLRQRTTPEDSHG